MTHVSGKEHRDGAGCCGWSCFGPEIKSTLHIGLFRDGDMEIPSPAAGEDHPEARGGSSSVCMHMLYFDSLLLSSGSLRATLHFRCRRQIYTVYIYIYVYVSNTTDLQNNQIDQHHPAPGVTWLEAPAPLDLPHVGLAMFFRSQVDGLTGSSCWSKRSKLSGSPEPSGPLRRDLPKRTSGSVLGRFCLDVKKNLKKSKITGHLQNRKRSLYRRIWQ